MRRGLAALRDRLGAYLGLGMDLDAEPLRVWRHALRSSGVDNVVEKRITLFKPPRLEGVHVPFTVGIEPSGSAGSLTAVVRIAGAPAIVSLQHDSIARRALRIVGAADLVLGDPVFDAAFVVVGDPVVVRAIFDEPTRARALRLFGRGRSTVNDLLGGDDGRPTGIGDGAIVACFEAEGARSTLPAFLADALALAGRITDEQAEERLREVACTDSLAVVRRGALETLRDRRPGHTATRAALEAACFDADPQLRLLAASALGATKGRETLLALATAPRVPDEVAAGAIGELRSRLPAEQALAILDAALGAGRDRTAMACLDTLSRLGAHADVAARVLETMPSLEVGLAAAHALRRSGTPAQVELLLQVAAKRGDPLAGECRAAVAAIQSRQAGASAGQVSLAADDAGRVSLPADESGRVSLESDQPAGPRDDS